MIEVQDVQFRYPKGSFALQVHHLSVADRQCVCWVGPSGTGKTTLLHLVAGIHAADAGRVTACNQDLSIMSDAARRDFRIANVGLVFQDFALLDYLNVLDNILLPYRISRALRMDTSDRQRAIAMAASLGIDSLLSRKPTELSQGERQRVAVCRAVITRPKLLLADEPTANLDADNSARVLDTLLDYASRQDATLVVVSHDRETIDRFEDRVDVSAFCTQSRLDQSSVAHESSMEELTPQGFDALEGSSDA